MKNLIFSVARRIDPLLLLFVVLAVMFGMTLHLCYNSLYSPRYFL
jgi:hypothetical protein